MLPADCLNQDIMIRIIHPNETIQKICGAQKTRENLNYTDARHSLNVPDADGILLFQTLTGELLLLTEEEWNARMKDEDIRRKLIESRFLVPTDFDERVYADEIERILSMFVKKPERLSNYTIFTTLDCNARCFYCYELGARRDKMEKKTAEEAASFIIRNSKGGPVRLAWFGGEPLMNSAVIDTISKSLKNHGISYTARMVSNGYFFDGELVRRAKDQWNLKKIQITLDGTEEIYNRTKAYVDQGANAYRRVMRNIALLLDAGIRVRIRLNMNSKNALDLNCLTEELAGRFAGKTGLNVYVALLHQYGSHSVGAFSDEHTALEEHRALTEKIHALGLRDEGVLHNRIKNNYCMADSDENVMILPDGRIGKCEHELEADLIGTVSNDALDAHGIRVWKELLKGESCNTCPLYPRCRILKRCARYAEGCSEMDRQIIKERLIRVIINTYENINSGKKPNAEEDSEFC